MTPNQLIRVNGEIMAVAMMVNTQQLMCREDILSDLGIHTPTTWDEVYAAADKISAAGVVDYPHGSTIKSGWNLAQEFVNLYPAFGGIFFNDNNTTAVNSDAGIRALETMKEALEYTGPEVLVSDSTYVQQQFQQGNIAMANLWASRAGAMNDEAESQVVGKVAMAAAPKAMEGGAPATTLCWDGIVMAKNISDEEADAAFRLAMEGLDADMVKGANDAAIWLVEGYEPTAVAKGAIDTATANPASPPILPRHKWACCIQRSATNGRPA